MNLIQFRQSKFHQVIQSLQHDTDLNHVNPIDSLEKKKNNHNSS